jgi:hypothetical protein
LANEGPQGAFRVFGVSRFLLPICQSGLRIGG